ncbi:MAG: NAD+ synthase, partial [Cohaesibacter sp.]|nr:NAD+ synthase [Cohaesibacter sp.]
KDAYEKAKSNGADIVLTPELALSGYPPEDLVLRPAFLERIDAALHDLAKLTQGGPALVVGAPRARTHYGQCIQTNSAIVMENGEIIAEQDKVHLPNYGVFDEVRVFQSGPMPQPIMIAGVSCGLLICEDMWHGDVAKHLKLSGAQVLLVLNGSPFEDEKQHQRYDHAKARISET